MMTDKEILQKALDKAIRNGYEGFGKTTAYLHVADAYRLIFSYDFAKAFWGEEFSEKYECRNVGGYEWSWTGFEWEYHLQQMVLEENPIKYLEKGLKEI